MGMFGGSRSSITARPARPGLRKPARPPATPDKTDTPAREPTWGRPVMTVLFTGTTAIDRRVLQQALESAWPDEQPAVRDIFASSTEATLAQLGRGDLAKAVASDAAEAAAAGAGGPANNCEVRLGGIPITCLLIDAPTPGLDGMMQTSRGDREVLPQVLPKHTSHMICSTEVGPEHGIRATLQLFRLAAALENQGAIGVIQGDAWQCFLIQRLKDHLAPETLAKLDGPYFPFVWCNAIPFHGEGGSWMTSKGFAVAGVPDIAIWVRNPAEMKAAGEFLPNCFNYLHKGAVLKPGETIQMTGGGNYRIGPVTEFHDFLCGRGETLALRPV